ncbi:MAG: citramalate synthase [Planctomycetes bacterium]|nr:citramalate synthase [Planctomycetota bacterium]
MSANWRDIEIYDTTLRDGAQGEGISFSLHDKLQIALRLDEMGIDFIEGGYPLSNEKDAEFFQKAKGLSLRHAKLCAFGMTRRKNVVVDQDIGIVALRDSGAPVCTIVGKTWDFHVTDVLRATLDEHVAMIRDSVGYLAGQGREVIYDAEHFFDGWRANPEFARRAIRAAAEAGARIIVLCDTNGGSLPEQARELTTAARDAVAEFRVDVGIHCHNDGDLAVANTLAAIDAGAVHVQGTVNGIGERCGNADLISILANLGLKKPAYRVLGGRPLNHLTELSRYVYETANMHWRSSQPFVGQSAFAHKGGMHAHAIALASRTYEHVDPQLVGNERRILVSELSGRSNVLALSGKHQLHGDPKLMETVLAQVVALENEGYQFEAAEASFVLLVQRCASHFRPHFETAKYHVEVGFETGQGLVTEATVKVRIGDCDRHEVAEGDGPVNALDAALRKALTPCYPRLTSMRLTDYRVRVVNSEAGTAARIRVLIESADDTEVWGTVGVSENIIEASWIALLDAIEYKLYKDDERQCEPERASTERASEPAASPVREA